MVTKREFNRIKKQNPESRIGRRTRKEQKIRNELAGLLTKARKEGINTPVDVYVEKIKKLTAEEQQKKNNLDSLEQQKRGTLRFLEQKKEELGRINAEIDKMKKRESELNERESKLTDKMKKRESELNEKESKLTEKENNVRIKESILGKKEQRIKSKISELGIENGEMPEGSREDLEQLLMEELLEYRENRKMNIKGISKEIKEDIIKGAEKIKVTPGYNKYGEKFFQIKIGKEEYKIYDPKYEKGGYNEWYLIENFLDDLRTGTIILDEDKFQFASYLTGIDRYYRACEYYKLKAERYGAKVSQAKNSYYPDECGY